MPYAQVQSLTSLNIYYEDTGGDGPVIVFSHGFLMDRTMFAPQLEVLQGQYRCITWDQRGHGLTAGNRLSPFDFYDSANDLSGLLDVLGVKSAILVGMSQGGFLTLRCALTNPDAASALVLIDTEAGVMTPDQITANEGMLEQWIKSGFSEALGEAIAGQIIGPVLPGWDGTPYWISHWGATRFVNLIPSFDALITRDDITSAIGAISQPALVVHGALDQSVPVAAGQALAAGLTSATFAEIPGAGHASCLTHPALVNAQIVPFLAKLGH
ncbi:MAG TPA: alpha/beta hydrolase [Phenylobacterium sp.]|nr:alpha/beta hydrolase [Phenylobacterium sp.]